LADTTTDTIVVYSHPDCNYSDALKDELNELGITFEEIDLSREPDKWAIVEELSGGERITPVMVTGDVVEVGFQYAGFDEEIGVQSGIFTRRGCERVIKHAFELARRRDKDRRVTSVTKSNALGYGMLVWDRAFDRIAENYPDIETQSLLVDAACMDFIRKPEVFDVVVASNLFGDILTDIGAIVTGSMGMAPSGNIDPERRFPSMFEPVHGTAPDIVGTGKANPLAAIMSGSMMLRHLGEDEAADSVDNAALKIVELGETLTPDLGGSSTTEQVGDAVVSALG